MSKKPATLPRETQGVTTRPSPINPLSTTASTSTLSPLPTPWTKAPAAPQSETRLCHVTEVGVLLVGHILPLVANGVIFELATVVAVSAAVAESAVQPIYTDQEDGEAIAAQHGGDRRVVAGSLAGAEGLWSDQISNAVD